MNTRIARSAIVVQVGLCVLLGAIRVNAQVDTSTVVLTVTGRGTTPYEARTDAIRQALQQAVKQLIVADRAVDGDVLMKDQVLSTMNGFVQRFKPLESIQEKDEFVLRASVTVSPSQMANFIARPIDARSVAVDGQSIGAAIAAQRERAARAGAIVRRMFDGFPEQMVDVRIVNLTPMLQTEEVELQIEYALNPLYVESWRGVLGALQSAGTPMGTPSGLVVTVDQSAWRFLAPVDVEWLKPMAPFANRYLTLEQRQAQERLWYQCSDFYGCKHILPLTVATEDTTVDVDLTMSASDNMQVWPGEVALFRIGFGRAAIMLSSEVQSRAIRLPARVFERANRVSVSVRSPTLRFGLRTKEAESPPKAQANRTLQAPDASFGLRMGMKLPELKQLTGMTPAEDSPGDYTTTTVPAPHPFFQHFLLTAAPNAGLCRVAGVGGDVNTDADGRQLKEAFREQSALLDKRYGPGEEVEKLHPQSTWNRSGKWMTGLLENGFKVQKLWSERLPASIKAIVLSATAQSTSVGDVSMFLIFSNADACDRELKP